MNWNRWPHGWLSLVVDTGLMLILALVTSCGGNTGSSNPPPSAPSTSGTITTTLGDPPTCAVPNGQFQSVWVTVTKVTANVSGDAGPTDGGWQTLVDLTSNPKQIDLLTLASAATELGSASSLPSGTYQQIRLYLLSNSPAAGVASPSTNNCGSNGFNCALLSGGSVQTLELSSEAQTGIKIPSAQIAGGGINLAASQSATLNLDFDACDSIVTQGNGRLRLKPVLHAGEISSDSDSISGRVVDGSTTPPTPIVSAVVMLEQSDTNNTNIDRSIRSGLTASDGTFTFSSVPSGNYDVVAAAATVCCVDIEKVYNATVTLKVPSRTSMGDIPLVPEPTVRSILNAATIAGMITATSSSATIGADADISVSALQSVGRGSPLLVTVPQLSAFPTAVSTTNPLPGSSSATICGGGTGSGCVTYRLTVPASNPQVGTYSASPPTSYAPPEALPAVYWVNAQAFVPMNATSNAGTPDCSPSSLPQTFDSSTQIQVGAGQTTTMNFAFTGCQ